MSESSSVFNIFPIAYVQGKQLEKYQELIILMWFFYGNYLLCGETNENRRVSIKWEPPVISNHIARGKQIEKQIKYFRSASAWYIIIHTYN